MAGDWIKMRTDLYDDPRVIRISSLTCPKSVTEESHRYGIVGRLYALWTLADKHSVDGNLRFITPANLDDMTKLPGFASAMAEVEWLEITTQGIRIPNFREHNGQSAKKRAQAFVRQQRKRDGLSNSVTLPSRSERDKNVTKALPEKRIEKNREDYQIPTKTPPLPPLLSPEQFLAEWNAAVPFSQARDLRNGRLKHFQARCRDATWLAAYPQALARIRGSAFLRGENDRGWKANIDWFLKPDTVSRILEGAYDGNASNGNGRPSRPGRDLGPNYRAIPEPGKYDRLSARIIRAGETLSSPPTDAPPSSRSGEGHPLDRPEPSG